jgi:hypothetical protein
MPPTTSDSFTVRMGWRLGISTSVSASKTDWRSEAATDISSGDLVDDPYSLRYAYIVTFQFTIAIGAESSVDSQNERIYA